MKAIQNHAAALLAAVLTFIPAIAGNEYILEVVNDQKVIHTDALGLPEGALLQDVLTLLPELLNRPGEQLLANYDLEVNGFSVGDAKESVILQTKLSDIEKITISESSLSSYTNNGQGGTVGITLKSVANGLSGKVNMDLADPLGVLPSFQISSKKDKLLIRGFLSVDYERPGISDRISDSYRDGKLFYTMRDSTNRCSTYEMGRLYVQYKPTEKDAFDFYLHESLNDDKIPALHAQSGVLSSSSSLQCNRSFDLALNGKYTRTLGPDSKLVAELKGKYNPMAELYESTVNNIQSMDKSSSIGGKVEYKGRFLRESDKRFADFTGGVNANFSSRRLDVDQVLSATTIIPLDVRGRANYNFVSPYARVEGNWDRLHFLAEVAFQSYSVHVREADNQSLDKNSGDVTAKAVLGWQFAEHQHLRLLFNRSLSRPSAAQLYPALYYYSDSDEFILGNASLTPMIMNEIGLDYITDRDIAGGKLLLNASAKFINVSDIISQTDGDRSLIPGFPVAFLSYANEGVNNIVNADLLLYYRRGIVSASLTGELFANNKGGDHYTHFNMAFTPSVHLPSNWLASVSIVYHSPVSTVSSVLSGCSYGVFHVSKSWDRFECHANARLRFGGRAKDETGLGNSVTKACTYDMIRSGVIVGMGYSF